MLIDPTSMPRNTALLLVRAQRDCRLPTDQRFKGRASPGSLEKQPSWAAVGVKKGNADVRTDKGVIRSDRLDSGDKPRYSSNITRKTGDGYVWNRLPGDAHHPRRGP